MQVEFEIMKTFCKQYVKGRCKSVYNTYELVAKEGNNCREIACPIGKLQFRKDKKE